MCHIKLKNCRCIRPSINLIAQTLRNDLIIPCWGEFTAKIKEIFDEVVVLIFTFIYFFNVKHVLINVLLILLSRSAG